MPSVTYFGVFQGTSQKRRDGVSQKTGKPYSFPPSATFQISDFSRYQTDALSSRSKLPIPYSYESKFVVPDVSLINLREGAYYCVFQSLLLNDGAVEKPDLFSDLALCRVVEITPEQYDAIHYAHYQIFSSGSVPRVRTFPSPVSSGATALDKEEDM